MEPETRVRQRPPSRRLPASSRSSSPRPLSIPKGIPLDRAATLLCAGITTYSPLRHFGLEAGDKLGVVGLGGLGHMAVKFGHAMSAHVTVHSQSPGKRDNALALGADDFLGAIAS